MFSRPWHFLIESTEIRRKMSETPDITSLFRDQHESWDPDSELGSIIYLTREPITNIPVKAIVIASNEVMKSRGNNCKIVREAGGDTFRDEVSRNVELHGHLERGHCRAVKSSG